MDTTTAAATAGVTTDTIRTWCRYGAITATKRAGRWVINAASLTHRITIGKLKKAMTPKPDQTQLFLDELSMTLGDLTDATSTAPIKALLKDVQTRDTHGIAGVPREHVHLTDTQWAHCEQQVHFQLSTFRAEHPAYS